jgi:oligopeptide/dipeptide ABC transporter ATP-binding protein
LTSSHPSPLLEVSNLTVEFPYPSGWTPVVDDVSFSVGRGEVVGLVGESGSGKTVTSLAVLGLLPYRGGRVASGSVTFDGKELMGLSTRGWNRIRGDRVGMIFQQPILTLNPAYTVGDQIAETVRRHRNVSRRESWAQAVAMLERVHIPKAAQRARDYPHMFSGGMCQRVMIAQALVCGPDLLIADEPTTALDVTIQSSVLELLRELEDETGIAVLLITHDLAVIAEMADRVVVMYAGQVVEQGDAADVLVHPRHPYTEALLSAVPTESTRRLVTVPGTVPTPEHIPGGCRFAPRCPHAVGGRCDTTNPALVPAGAGRLSRCVRVAELYATELEAAGRA